MSLAQNSLNNSLSKPALLQLKIERLRAKVRTSSQGNLEELLTGYRYRPYEYFKNILKVDSIWSGADSATTGLKEIVDAYLLALQQQREKIQYEHNRIAATDLVYFDPAQPIRNWISVDAGYNIGKTWIAAKLLSHFFDCFSPAIGYCFAPGWDQINDLLFKEIRIDRQNENVLGETLERRPIIKYKPNHFVTGRATQGGAKGSRKERIQGQHNEHLIFVLDEAEGIEDYVFESVRAMASGGTAIVLFLRNPRTATCYANQLRSKPYVVPFTISCLDHPNVREGRDVISSAVRRTWVDQMIDEYAQPVTEYDREKHTFSVPWRGEQIYQPQVEFLWQVLGVASEGRLDNTFVSIAAYNATINREIEEIFDPKILRIGIDAARYGFDKLTIYCRWNGRIWRSKVFDSSNYHEAAMAVKKVCTEYLGKGVNDIAIRIDAGGGFGGGIADFLNYDAEINSPLDTDIWYGIDFLVIEVNGNSNAYDTEKFRNLETEMYFYAGKILQDHALLDPCSMLKVDLTERKYEMTRLNGRDVRVLSRKKHFKTLHNRSPDDGDGFVLAAAPDHLFDSDLLIAYR